MTDENLAACSGCGAEARIPGQRYGRKCMNEANRKYRARLRQMMDAFSGRALRRPENKDFVSVKKGINESLK